MGVAASLLSFACHRGSAPPSQRAGGGLTVRVATVASQDVVYEVRVVGSLQADEIVQVTAQLDGAVQDVTLREGLHVTPETTLLRIDPDRYALEARQADAAYKRVVADHATADTVLKRREALAQEKLVSDEEMTRARREAEALGAQAEAARATRDIAFQRKERSEVRPPRAGVIDTKKVETGQFVKEGDILATLVDTSRLRLRFLVSETESLRTRVGQTVTFRVAALGDLDFEARIYHVGQTADATSRQVEVLAWVRNPGVLKPGFFADVALATESRKGAIVIPESAVQASERGFIAYAVEDGKARARVLQIGLRTGTGLVEILSGLKAGETVVSEGSDRLADGVAVRVADEGGAPPPAARPAPAAAAGPSS